MALLQLGAQIDVVAVNELPSRAAYGAPSMSDVLYLHATAPNKSTKIELADLLQFLTTGGGATVPASTVGPVVIYRVPSGAAGSQTASIPSLAGRNFYLERSGQPLDPGIDYDVLVSGGFQLKKSGDTLRLNEAFSLLVFDYIGGSNVGSGQTSSGFLSDAVSVSSNQTYDTVNHKGKLIQLRGGGNKISYTLPLLSDVPAGTVIPIEATINNTQHQRIASQGGQSIYVTNAAKTAVYLAPGEACMLMKTPDGWIDITGNLPRNYAQVGKIEDTYKAGPNQLALLGQELLRADEPRLWDWIQTTGSVVTDTDWLQPTGTINGRQVERPNRGFFSSGNGATTFRLSDPSNLFVRTLKQGSDNQRLQNIPGAYQPYDTKDMGGRDDANPNDGINTGLSYAAGSAEFKMRGTETRSENIGLHKVINC